MRFMLLLVLLAAALVAGPASAYEIQYISITPITLNEPAQRLWAGDVQGENSPGTKLGFLYAEPQAVTVTSTSSGGAWDRLGSPTGAAARRDAPLVYGGAALLLILLFLLWRRRRNRRNASGNAL